MNNKKFVSFTIDSSGILHEGEILKEFLNNFKKEIYNEEHPIGSGFIDFTETDYSNYLGLKWERTLLGVFPVGYKPNDSDFGEIGKTGGEKTHIMTVAEMPSHEHNMYHSGRLVYWDSNLTQMGKITTGSGSVQSTYDAKTANTGGGQPHNNIPPYEVVAYWKRVA